MAEFKKISDVEVLESLTDGDNVLVVGSDGALKQTASSNVKGSASWNDLTDKPFGEEDGVVTKIDEKYIPYVVIDMNEEDGTLSCNVSDINTLVSKLEAFPLIIFRVLTANGIYAQTIVCSYEVGRDDNNNIEVVDFISATDELICCFENDGTISRPR